MRSRSLLVGLSVLALLASCGGDDDTDLERSDAEVTEDASTDPGVGSDGSGAPDGQDGEDGEARPGGSDGPGDTGGGTGEEPTDGSDAGGSGAGDSAEPAAVPDLTSQEICDRVPAPVVANALGVGSVTAQPAGASGTPQCSYEFEGADGVPSEATIAVLRTDEDLDGRVGEAAYDYTLDLNRRAASGSDFQEIPMSVGDEAVLFDSERIRFGVVRYGGRIVTIVVPAGAAGADAAMTLSAATTPLAP